MHVPITNLAQQRALTLGCEIIVPIYYWFHGVSVPVTNNQFLHITRLIQWSEICLLDILEAFRARDRVQHGQETGNTTFTYDDVSIRPTIFFILLFIVINILLWCEVNFVLVSAMCDVPLDCDVPLFPCGGLSLNLNTQYIHKLSYCTLLMFPYYSTYKVLFQLCQTNIGTIKPPYYLCRFDIILVQFFQPYLIYFD